MWALSQPAKAKNFQIWMNAVHQGKPSWLDAFPFEQLIHDLRPQTPLFVDIGGGIGSQCGAVRAKFPHAGGRVVLQELPPAIQQAIPMEGVEFMVHDFWTEQPIKGTELKAILSMMLRSNSSAGARAYYFRNILHDYPDEKCVLLLHQTMKAMEKDSLILIDEMILPNQGMHWHATLSDINMMASLAGMERTERQWVALLDLAGLRVQRICPYTEKLRESIIAAVPK